MRIRAALLITALAATIAAPLAATSHTTTAACHGTDRVINIVVNQPGLTIYNDDRGFVQYQDLPADVRPVLQSADDPIPYGDDNPSYPGGRFPAISRTTANEGNLGFWLYLEANNHEGLQTGGDHAVFGETGNKIGFTDDCRATHNVGGTSVGYDAILF